MLIILEDPHQDSLDEIKLVQCGSSIACAFGMGTGVSPLGFRRVLETLSESLDTIPLKLWRIADMH
jgi:hypothetical protein